MSMTAGLHTEDLVNKHPLKVEFRDWTSATHIYALGYITLRLEQVGGGEVTVYVRHSMYCDLIAGLEDAARQLREIVAKEMVMTWGFPRPHAEPDDTIPAEDAREYADASR